MGSLRIEASALIAAPPERVYGVLADYRVGHPAILPRPPFTGLTVEAGGRGAGTVIVATTRVAGQTRALHMTVSEPEPGRVLRERADDGSADTSFIVDPADGGQSRVTITTMLAVRDGPLGLIERLLTRPLMERVYRRELENLRAYVAR
jgi:hypothetical protein